MTHNYDCIVLFSGGLDSLLTAKILQAQGLTPLCVHFHSPFFGSPRKKEHWERLHGIDILTSDASMEFAKMLVESPQYGTGKTLNPCIDCKILLLNLARELLHETGAKFIATGEVAGQRPMSQRREAMDLIAKKSGCADLLLRPLCAKHLPPTPMEACGIVDREKLLSISGRSRNMQLSLAREIGLSEIPTPAGGCKLTEIENSRRYWVVLNRFQSEASSRSLEDLNDEFRLANLGRMLVDCDNGFKYWLCIGRNKSDNEKIAQAKKEKDLLLRLPFPGPLALCLNGRLWPENKLREAADILAGYSARVTGQGVEVRATGAANMTLYAYPDKHTSIWGLPEWSHIREIIRGQRRSEKARKE